MDTKKIKDLRSRIPVGISEANSLLATYGSVESAVSKWTSAKESQKKKAEQRKYDDISSLWMFDKAYCENIVESEKKFLKPLSEHYCSQLWRKYVSEKQLHLMLANLDSELKFKDEEKQKYAWLNDWNEDNYDAFKEKIAPLFSWHPEDEVLFFWGRNAGLETNWKYLCKYWIAFLYDDEMNIVINPSSSEVLILGVNGYVAKALRKV